MAGLAEALRANATQEQVLIQAEQPHVTETPPSYETVARQVMVSEGSSGWKRVRIRNHCAG